MPPPRCPERRGPRRMLCECVRMVRARVCVCAPGLAELQSLCILEPKTWRCRCSCPRCCFILGEKLSLVCSLYL